MENMLLYGSFGRREFKIYNKQDNSGILYQIIQ